MMGTEWSLRKGVSFLLMAIALFGSAASAGPAFNCSMSELTRQAKATSENALIVTAATAGICAKDAKAPDKGEYLLLSAGVYRRLSVLSKRHFSSTYSLFDASARTMLKQVQLGSNITPDQRKAAQKELGEDQARAN